jgi:ribonuclease T1
VLALAGCGDDEQPQTFGSFTELESTTSTTTTGTDAPGDSTAALVPEDERAAVVAVLALIDSGVPLPYPQDGATFQNREGLLPDEPIGYYREYTVPTPGSPDRGARRLVIGENGETWYTNDHYASFVRIEPEDFQ